MDIAGSFTWPLDHEPVEAGQDPGQQEDDQDRCDQTADGEDPADLPGSRLLERETQDADRGDQDGRGSQYRLKRAFVGGTDRFAPG